MNLGMWLGYFIVAGAIIYFMMILPQQRRSKKAREMVNSIVVGSNVVTIGGICGKVVNIKDEELTIETSVKKTHIVLCKWAIREVIKPVEA